MAAISYNPLVTIITNTKNRASLISRCIESVQAQTYHNYEHIIVDGGTDNTEWIVRNYNDPKIKYFKVSEGGPIAQTKTAFNNSTGELVTFLDDDDEYLPDKIQKQVDLILSLSSDFGFIYGSMSYYDNNTGKYLFDHEAKIEGGKEILPQAISDALVCGTPTLMFKRDVFASLGGTWISGIGNEMSDWALGCKALSQGWKVARLKESYLKIYVNHSAVRMTDGRFYKDNSQRYILFHNYFLNEYEDIIKMFPKSASIHYKNLIFHYLKLGHRYVALKIWIRLLRSSLSLKNLLYYPYYFFKNILSK